MTRTFLNLTVALVLAQPAGAGVISVGTWSPVAPGAFYDTQPSWDGATAGIGYQLAGIPGLEYLNLAGAAVPWTFNATDLIGSPLLLGEIAGYATLDEERYASTDDATAGTLFYGSDVPGATAVLPALPSVRFYQVSPDGLFDCAGGGYQNCVVFRETLADRWRYYVGHEDLVRGDFDFNDAFWSVEERIPGEEPHDTTPVPEVPSLGLLGAGLLWLVARLRGKADGRVRF